MKWVKQLNFCNVKKDFQKIFHQNMKKMQTSKKKLTPADKTSNMYRHNTNDYQNLLRNAVTTVNKK